MTQRAIIEAAAEVADAGGVAAVTMRSVAKVLGVEAMSLYYHVANKDALLDSLADWVFEQIILPDLDEHWRLGMIARAHSARSVLSKHSWALGMLESRPTPGEKLLRHHDRILGCLLRGGMSPVLAAHAFSAIDSYIYGFVLTEASISSSPENLVEEGFSAEVAKQAEKYPNMALIAMAAVNDYNFTFEDEFDYGLSLILDGFDERLQNQNKNTG
ncbi:MAG: TetR/AcrR family transcriptional regulator C-terminal domain-containing protein [Aquiluna sp.]|nr:TetR/AcrR family transcriptional regulator C-terminal domain-containing protein [Aquiluna sp.]